MRQLERAARQGNALVSAHRLSGEEAQMLGRLLAASRLVEQAAVDIDDAVAADHPIVPAARSTETAFATASPSAIAEGSQPAP